MLRTALTQTIRLVDLKIVTDTATMEAGAGWNELDQIMKVAKKRVYALRGLFKL